MGTSMISGAPTPVDGWTQLVSEGLDGMGFEGLDAAARAAAMQQNLAAATRLKAAHLLVRRFTAEESARDAADERAGRRPRPTYARLDPAGRARDHLSGALAMTTWHAGRLVTAGVQIHTRLHRLRKAVAHGLYPESLAVETACGLAGVSDSVIAAVEAEVVTGLSLDVAGGNRPSRTALTSRIDEAVARYDPEAAERKVREAVKKRTVRFRSGAAGMMTVWATLPAEKGELLRRRVDADARVAAKLGVEGILDNHRADALCNLATADPVWRVGPGGVNYATGAGGAGGADAEGIDIVAPLLGDDLPRLNLGDTATASGQPIHITVISAAAAGLPNRVEFVRGAYSSFDWLCRELLEGGDAKVRFETIDPAPGALDTPEHALRYVLSPAMVKRIRGRDGTCRHPGCSVAAEHCDVDHVIAFDTTRPELSGPSCEWNLVCLCRAHHREKTFGHNSYRPGALGELIIISPTGAEFRTRPTGPLAKAREHIREQAWDAHLERLIAADDMLANPPGTPEGWAARES